MSYISYAVIALRLHEADLVVSQLREDKKNGIADWLNARKYALYGASAEDWKPFDGKTIRQLLNTDDAETYHSETHLIDALNQNLTNTKILVQSRIEIFFVDVFALFCAWHRRLADKLDLRLADTNRKCCLVMPYGLSDDCSFILGTYGQVWGGVVEAYLQGFLHPIVLRADDVTHLRNYLLKLPRLAEEPDEEKGRAIDSRFGRGSKPQFGSVS
jgi:hypothetical protein